MTRKHSTLILVLATLGAALAATPAAASDQYRSVNSITAGSAGQGSGAGEFSSVNAVTGGSVGEQTGSGDYRSVNAVVGDDGGPAISPQPAVATREADGFDWLDALIGALIASGLLMTALLAARSITRHRR